MRIKQGILRKVASILAAGATLLACTSTASAAEIQEYDVSKVGTASLSSFTQSRYNNTYNVTYVKPDGTTVAGNGQFSGDGSVQIGLNVTIDLQNVKPGDRITVPFHTTEDSYIPLYIDSLESSGYLSVNNQRVFTVKNTGAGQEVGHTVMKALTLTALNSVKGLTGKTNMSLTLQGGFYPGRINHFGRTSSALTVGNNTYTIPNPKQTQSAYWTNSARAIGVSSSAGKEVLQISADSYGWENSYLAGDQYSSLVQKKLKTNRVVLTKITPGETGTEIKSITPIDNITPDDLAAGYNATTWSNTYIKSKEGTGTNITLANLSAADMTSVDTVASKLPAHQAAVVKSGNVWYVAVNFGAIADDPKLPASQSGYGDATTTTFFNNVRAKGMPYPSMTMNFTVNFNDPSKKQTAKMDRWANSEWKDGMQNNWETQVTHSGWDLASTPLSADSSGSANSAVTVTFDSNGGTPVDSQKVKSGDTVAEPYTQRDKYTFAGWYLNNVKYDFNTPVTRDITLKAQWKVSSHTVTFDSNGGSSVASQTVEDKAKAKEPTVPTRSDWTFGGWYLNGVKYDFNTPVTQDITLKAGWKRLAPSIEFKDMHKRISAGSKSGQQKLTLDVKGTGETNKKVTPSDVVILVDETNSMRECADGSSKAGSGIKCSTGASKRDNLGNIIDSAVTSILATNNGLSADQQSRVSVIRFAGRNSKYPPKAVSTFTTSKTTALPNGWNQGDDLYQTGTDWASALEHVGDAGSTRSNVNKQIILVTDGLATAANEDYTKAGTTASAALNIKDTATLQKVIKAYGYANQRTMSVTQSLAKAGWHLRVIGVSADASATAMGDSYLAGNYPYVHANGDMAFYQKGSQPSDCLPQIEWLASVAKKAGDDTAAGSDFNATDISSITDALTSTVVTSTTMQNTVISDPLSDWVDPVGLVNGKATGITVSKDGKPMGSGYTAVYDASSRTVKVSFPDSLADGSVYSVSFEVTPSSKAKSDYTLSGTYPDTGDADTGALSAGKKGYFTNGDASLSWDSVTTLNGAPSVVSYKAKYAKPVTTFDSSNLPPVVTDKLPGTGGVASLMPVFIGAGLALSLAAAWFVRRRLA